jgi:uncharacterized membrane protein
MSPTHPPVWLRIVGVLGIVWNAIGVVSYLGHVGLMEPMGPPPEQPMPAIVTGSYAIGVFGAVLGCLGLALARRWARPVLWVSFIGLVVDWGWIFLVTQQWSFALGASVLVLADRAARNGWLR